MSDFHNTYQKVRRYTALVQTIIVGLLIGVALPFGLNYLFKRQNEKIPLEIIIGCTAFGILWVILGIIFFIRSGKTKDVNTVDGKRPGFSNTDASAVTYTDPIASTEVAVSPNESVLAFFAPALRSLTADTYIMGKKQLTGEENCIIITENQIIGILIAPQDIERYGNVSTASELINSFPGGSELKNQGTALFAKDSMRTTAKEMLTQESLSQIVSSHYSISIQRSEVQEISFSKWFGFKFKTAIGTFRWSFGTPKESIQYLNTLKSLGLPVR